MDGLCPSGCTMTGVPLSAFGFLGSVDVNAPICLSPPAGATIGLTSALRAGAVPIDAGFAPTARRAHRRQRIAKILGTECPND